MFKMLVIGVSAGAGAGFEVLVWPLFLFCDPLVVLLFVWVAFLFLVFPGVRVFPCTCWY
jgi:hypothetical protein